jgi:hypothetical protein
VPLTTRSPAGHLGRRKTKVPLSLGERYSRGTLSALALFVALSACKRKRVCQTGASAQIVGGARVDTPGLDEHGRRTAGYFAAGSLCTAVPLSQEYAVTAKHCLKSNDRGYLFFGKSLGVLTQRRRVTSTDGHPSDDVALVRFEGGLPAGYFSTRLAPFDTFLSPGTPLVITGYGRSDASKEASSGVLYKTSLRYVRAAVDPMRAGIATAPLLWLDATAGRGACNGDSGGPAFLRVGAQWTVVGFTQGGEKRCGNEYNRYTDARLVGPWISARVPYAVLPSASNASFDSAASAGGFGQADAAVAYPGGEFPSSGEPPPTSEPTSGDCP